MDRPISSFRLTNLLFQFVESNFIKYEANSFTSKFFRQLVRRTFEFLQNATVCSLIILWGTKTQNRLLEYIGLAATCVLSLSFCSYFSPLVKQISFKVKSSILRHILDFIVYVVIWTAFSLFVAFGVFSLVQGIAVSNVR